MSVSYFSAGIGRTGTYIGLDTLTKEGQTEGAVDIPGCVKQMRECRTNMVQNAVRTSSVIVVETTKVSSF